MIELSDDQSDDARDGSVDKKPKWLSIANAFMDTDPSLDFTDLSGLQQGLEGVDRRVKAEQIDLHVKIESPPPVDAARDAPLPITARCSSSDSLSRTTQQAPVSSQLSGIDETLCEPGIEDDLDLPVGEITLEKLQAHFRAMEDHKNEAAKMLKVLAGVHRGLKRKEGPGSTETAGKKRRMQGQSG